MKEFEKWYSSNPQWIKFEKWFLKTKAPLDNHIETKEKMIRREGWKAALEWVLDLIPDVEIYDSIKEELENLNKSNG